MRFATLHPALVLISVYAAGCGGGTKLKPMPVLYGPGRADLCSIIPESRRDPAVHLFYATNRAATGPLENRKYTNGVDKRLHLGTATVDVGGKDATWDDVCRASSGRGGNPTFHMRRAVELGALGSGASADASAKIFSKAINEQLAISPNKQVNVYVHGFRTNMPVELETQAKLLHCMGRRGVVVCFAWPARQSLLLYGQDVDRGMRSAHHLANLIEMLASTTDADRINVLGYSCGAAVATAALCQVRERHKEEDPQQLSKRLRIGNIILAASDIDLQAFAREQLAPLQDLSDNLVIYIARNDMALALSSFGYRTSRLGRPDVSKLKLTRDQLEEAARDESLQVVDVSDVPGPHASGGGFGGHGYWYANSWIMTDLLVTLRWQVGAKERGLVRKPGLARWFFPRDYPTRINEAVRTLVEPTSAPAIDGAPDPGHGAPASQSA